MAGLELAFLIVLALIALGLVSLVPTSSWGGHAVETLDEWRHVARLRFEAERKIDRIVWHAFSELLEEARRQRWGDWP